MNKGNVLKRNIVIKAKVPDSAYYKKNAKYIELKPRPLGSTITVVNQIKANPTLVNKVLPIVLGIQPTDSRWGQHVSIYLDGYNSRISETGKTLDISLTFAPTKDVYDVNNKLVTKGKTAEQVIEEFTGKQNTILTSYSKKVQSNPKDEKSIFKIKEEDELILEDEYLQNATPTNPIDYLLWRISRIHKHVANREADRKINHITHYLEDKGELERLERERFKLQTKANEKYFEVAKDAKRVSNILRVMVKAHEGINLDTMDTLDKQRLLMNRININPNEFLHIVKDDNLDPTATIEEYVSLGILRRLKDSSVIVENGTSDIIGNTLSDTIAFFKNTEQNKLKLAQFKEKYNARPKQ